ncbi:MAG: hypothetical protein R2941_23065 [Desulfobacterales bacterium]
MVLRDDYVDSLAEEVLTEMATSFFGARKQVDDSITVLERYAESLRKKAEEVEAGARFLAWMMVSPETVAQFYQTIGISENTFPLEGEVSDRFLPGEMPGALTAKGVFVKLTIHAYKTLQKLCDEYMNGKKANDMEKHDPNAIDSGYRIMQALCQLVNEQINKINSEMRPGQTLRYFKRFSPGTETKEDITGGMTFGASGSECRLNRALAFEPIDMNSFCLKEYPVLPAPDEAEAKLISLCKKVWDSRQKQARDILEEVKKRLRHHR